MKQHKRLFIAGVMSFTMAMAFVLVTPAPADAFIHEIIAAMCRAGGEEVIPPGQIRDGQSMVRALQATGFIESIEETPTAVIIHFDPTIPASKFMSAGFDLVLEDEIAPGVDLILSPLVIPNPDFPAHANCHNLNP
jgi:hypothetical protein